MDTHHAALDRGAPTRPRRWTTALGLTVSLAIALPALAALAAWPEKRECVFKERQEVWCGATAIGEISEAQRLGTQCKACGMPPRWHDGMHRNQSAGRVLGRFR